MWVWTLICNNFLNLLWCITTWPSHVPLQLTVTPLSHLSFLTCQIDLGWILSVYELCMELGLAPETGWPETLSVLFCFWMITECTLWVEKLLFLEDWRQHCKAFCISNFGELFNTSPSLSYSFQWITSLY